MRSAEHPDASILPSQAHIRQCFQQLKPICVQIMEEQTKLRIQSQSSQNSSGPSSSSNQGSYSKLYQSLCELKSTIEIMPPDSLMGCLDYVLFPLTQLLSQYNATQPFSQSVKHRESCYIVTMNVLATLFQLASQTSLKSHTQLDLALIASKVIADARGFSAMLQIITRPFPSNSQTTTQSNQLISDEFQCACLHALSGLLSAASSQILLFLSFNKAVEDPVDRINHSFVNFIYSPSFHIAAGFTVSLCLSIIRSSKHRQSRAEACQTLECLIDCLEQTAQGRAMLASYLPGAVSALYSVLTSSSVNLSTTASVNQATGRIVQISCINLLTRLIDCVMTDEAVLAIATQMRQKSSEPSLIPVKNDQETAHQSQALSQFHQLQHRIMSTKSSSQQPVPNVQYDRYGWDASKDTSASPVPTHELLVDRNEQWVAETTARLTQCLIDIFNAPFLGACHPTVTCAFINSSARFIMHCSQLFPNCLVVWLEFLVGATQNSQSLDVQKLANEKLASIRSTGLTISQAMLPMIYERLRQHWISLPRVLRSASPHHALRLMRLITGYVQLLGDAHPSTSDSQSTRLFEFLSSHQNFPELFHCLVHAMVIDTHDVRVIERAALNSTDDNDAKDLLSSGESKSEQRHQTDELLADDHTGGELYGQIAPAITPESVQYQVRFVHASSDELRTAMLAIPFQIGLCTGSKIGELLDALLSFLPEEEALDQLDPSFIQSVGPAFVIINSIIRGIRARYRLDQSLNTVSLSIKPYLELAFEAYLASPCMHLPVFDYRTQSEITSNALIRALVLRGLAELIDCMIDCNISESIHMMVKDSLFQVICSLGSPSVLVSSAAMATLTSMARLGDESINQSINGPDVGQFIMQNADYVVDQIAAHLRLDDFDQSYSNSINQSINRERAWALPHLLSALLDSPQVMIPVVGLSDVLSLIIDKLNSTLISSGDVEETYGQSLDRSDVYDASEEWRCAYLQSILSLTRAVRRYFQIYPPTTHPSSEQSIYQSAQTITFDQLLIEQVDEHSNYYSATNIADRVKAKRAEWKKGFDEPTDTSRETPEEWYSKMEAKRKMKEQLDELGLDSSALDDEEQQEAKRKHEEWQKKDRENEEATATIEQAAVISILKQARFYLACRSLRELRLVLSIIENSIHCLVGIPKELFPLLAQLWPAFVLVLKQQRSTNQQLQGASFNPTYTHQSNEALLAALSLLECLCSTASRFLASRFYKDAWPHLKQVLIDQTNNLAATQTLNEQAAADSVHTKVLSSVLRSLCSLLSFPDLMHNHVREIVCQLTRLIERSLPQQVQTQAMKAILQCAAMDRDITSWALYSAIAEDKQPNLQHITREDETDVKALDWDYITKNGLDRDGRLMLHYQRAVMENVERSCQLMNNSCDEGRNAYAHNVIELQQQIDLMKEIRK